MADNRLNPSSSAELSSEKLSGSAAPKRRLRKPMLIMIGVVLLIVLIIAGTKFMQISKMIAQSKMPQPPAIVTATTVQFSDWQPNVSAVGSTKAYRGVDVTTEVGGIVRTVAFKSGQDVAAGQLLLQLNADTELAQLRSLEATAALAAIVLKRDRAQLKEKVIAQAQVDADEGDWKAKQAAAEQQRALVDKKAIRAPFAGRIGITSINPGQYLNPGDKVATLTMLNPIYVDFNVPQGQRSQIALGQAAAVTTEGLPGQTFAGKVTAMDTKIDQTTRNVMVEATLPNPGQLLLPGMFSRVVVASGAPQRYLTIPQTAVTYNPYGTTVFVAVTKDKVLTAQQTFIQTGATRGDQVAVLSGLKEGDTVVTSGQMKLKNGSPVKIDNSNQPANDASPTPQEK